MYSLRFFLTGCVNECKAVLLSEPNSSLTSTTVAHGFSATRIPVETFEKRKKIGFMFSLTAIKNVKTKFGFVELWWEWHL